MWDMHAFVGVCLGEPVWEVWRAWGGVVMDGGVDGTPSILKEDKGTPHLSVSVNTASQYGSFARSPKVGRRFAFNADPNPSPPDPRTPSSSA